MKNATKKTVKEISLKSFMVLVTTYDIRTLEDMEPVFTSALLFEQFVSADSCDSWCGKKTYATGNENVVWERITGKEAQEMGLI